MTSRTAIYPRSGSLSPFLLRHKRVPDLPGQHYRFSEGVPPAETGLMGYRRGSLHSKEVASESSRTAKTGHCASLVTKLKPDTVHLGATVATVQCLAEAGHLSTAWGSPAGWSLPVAVLSSSKQQ